MTTKSQKSSRSKSAVRLKVGKLSEPNRKLTAAEQKKVRAGQMSQTGGSQTPATMTTQIKK